MARFSSVDRTIYLKLVYCGPPHAGKGTNLQRIQEVLAPEGEAEVVQLDLTLESALLFESPFLPLALDPPSNLVAQVFTVSGEVQDAMTRRALLRDVDGIVFVADSRRDRFRANLMAWTELLEHLRCLQLSLAGIPLVMQYNQIDREGVMEAADLDAALNSEGYPSFPAQATTGQGIGKCFSEIVRRVMARCHGELSLQDHGISRGALASAVDAGLLTAARGRHRTAPAEGPEEAQAPEQAAPAPVSDDPPPAEAEAIADEPAPTSVATPEDTASTEAPEPFDAPETPHTEPATRPAENGRSKAAGATSRPVVWVDPLVEALSERCRTLQQHTGEYRDALQELRSDLRRPLDFVRGLLGAMEDSGIELPVEIAELVAGGGEVIECLEERLSGAEPKVEAAGSDYGLQSDCDLEAVLDQVARHLRPAMLEQDVHAQIPHLPTLRADRGTLTLLFRILFEAILEYSVFPGESSELAVSSRQNSRGFLLELRERPLGDTGVVDALPTGDDHMPRLPVAEQIVALHGGQMKVVWEPSSGVVIRLALPPRRLKSPVKSSTPTR